MRKVVMEEKKIGHVMEIEEGKKSGIFYDFV
jgi:hypothetical protein